ncbi:3-hydroxyanthranilic acid dioxygenase [Pleurotus pulmonarius]|nr:3-hydroxyanthranilic acid dioxygenase [Pleurotus pulmonarius]KAF4585286.1 3-hydroxyanthranilic acid dioxygenase [Pleurotus pulmonarius]
MPFASPLNLPLWLKNNEHLLQPPVNNFCVHRGGDFVVMAVGGPNERSDYHINETEEWFYQYKGGMLLRVVEDNQFRDVRIEEGEMFLLPANTPHNPVRFADTVGIVVERVRPEGAMDRLRWYCHSSVHPEPTIIYEETFHVTDLGSQLKPVIKKWMERRDLRKCRRCGQYADEQYFTSARL